MAITLNGSTGITTDIDGDESLTLNRDTSDGDIITLQKDNSTVGSIGTNSSRTYVGSGSGQSGIKFNTNAIVPVAGADGVNSDNTFNLGVSSARFKDLYLSGGVYVGGTGSANYLDDYEEGTWTPGVSVGTASTTNGNYTKIGNTVHVWGYITGFSNTTNNEPQNVTGLPFTPAGNRASGSAMWDYVNGDNRYGTVYVTSSPSYLKFYDASRDNGFDDIRCIDMDGSGTSVHFTATYYTNS